MGALLHCEIFGEVGLTEMKRDIEIAGLPWQTLEFERRGEGEFERAIVTMLCVCVLC